MLAKKYRLPIQNFYNEPGKAVKNSFFVVKVKKSKLSFSRFGIVVGGKVDKRAARRNFIRRAILNWIRDFELHKKPGKDVMIIVLPKAKELNVSELIFALREIMPVNSEQ